MRLTAQQIADRAALVARFRIALYETVWCEIENTDPALLCADDGSPYSGHAGPDDHKSQLGQMADKAADAAADVLKNWL